jgi:hypothetical protein
MAKNDFMQGLLMGLYQSGVGNPQVGRQNREDAQNQQLKQAELNQNAAANGMIPVPQPKPTMGQTLGRAALNGIFPGSQGPQLNTAFQPNPNAMNYSQDPTGKTVLAKGPVPAGSVRLPPDKGATALALQGRQKQPYTDEQYAAIESGDSTRVQAAFPNGVPGDVISKQATVTGANARKDWAQVWKDRLELQKRQAVYGGAFGKNQLSLNTALGHVATAQKAFDAVGNMDEKFLNTPINKLKEQTNDPNIVSLGISLNALRGEVSNVFKGSGATDSEIGSWKEYLNRDLTPAQYGAAINQIGELLNSRLDALQYQQGNVVPGMPQTRPTLSPNAQKTNALLNRNKSSQGAPPGKIKVSNGSKSFWISPADLPAAQKDGFQQQ